MIQLDYISYSHFTRFYHHSFSVCMCVVDAYNYHHNEDTELFHDCQRTPSL